MGGRRVVVVGQAGQGYVGEGVDGDAWEESRPLCSVARAFCSSEMQSY